MNKEKDPAFLFYSQDFFTDTVLWDDAELGRYIRLLCLQHINGPFDPDEFERMTQVNDLNIRSKFETNDLGQFYNRKLEEVREKRNEFLSKQRENGKKGGRPKNPKETQTITQRKPKGNPTLNPNHNPKGNPNETMRVENENKVLSTLVSINKELKEILKDNGQIDDSTNLDHNHEEDESVNQFFTTIKIDGKDRPDPNDESHPFNVFWNEYPRRVKRIDAERSFKRNVADWETLRLIIVNISKRLASGEWNTEQMRFIPHPTTYLNNLMWEDEINAVHQTHFAPVSDISDELAKILNNIYEEGDLILDDE